MSSLKRFKLDLWLWKHFPGLMARHWAPLLGSRGYKIGFNCNIPSDESIKKGIVYTVIAKLEAIGLQVLPLHEGAANAIRNSGYWRDRLGEGVDLVVLAQCSTRIPMPDHRGITLGLPSCRFDLMSVFQADTGATINVGNAEVILGYDHMKPGKTYGRESWAFYSEQPKSISAKQVRALAQMAFNEIVHALYLAIQHPATEGGWLYDTSEWPFEDAPLALVSC